MQNLEGSGGFIAVNVNKKNQSISSSLTLTKRLHGIFPQVMPKRTNRPGLSKTDRPPRGMGARGFRGGRGGSRGGGGGGGYLGGYRGAAASRRGGGIRYVAPQNNEPPPQATVMPLMPQYHHQPPTMGLQFPH